MSKDNGGPARDRELLEMAAKAAGITSVGYGRNGIATGRNGPCLIGYWNPLTDDGDALRLAVKLGISIECIAAHDTVMAHIDNEHSSTSATEAMDDFGTRHAIVRAAAAIGSAM